MTNLLARTARLAFACAFGPPSLASVPPPDAEVVCGPVWAIREPHTGLAYFLGRPRAEPLAIGWGYDGRPVCAVATHAGRIAIVFPFVDPYGGTPSLTIVIVKGHEIVAKRAFVKRLMCWDIAPVAVRGTRDRWIVEFRCADDAAIEQFVLDHEGFER